MCVDLATPSPLIHDCPGVHAHADVEFDAEGDIIASLGITHFPKAPKAPTPKEVKGDEDSEEEEEEEEDVTLDIMVELQESPLVQDIKRPDFVQQPQQRLQVISPADSIPDERYRFDHDSGDIL